MHTNGGPVLLWATVVGLCADGAGSKACGPTSFRRNLTGFHCLGLAHHHNVTSERGCTEACCRRSVLVHTDATPESPRGARESRCSVWQWLELTDAAHSTLAATPGCWLGAVESSECTQDHAAHPHPWVGGATTPASPTLATVYTVDATPAMLGRVFDGVGAISGGGGETVLLPAYPATQRAEILDYLFRPAFGAALHILKIEIGGDALSTDGAEPSHRHTESEEPDFRRGYEWLVASEAAARNPQLKLYALPWEWPAWVGGGQGGKIGDPFGNVSRAAQYVVDWIHGADKVYGLAVHYVGVWNERPCPPAYVTALRGALDAAGFQATAIVAPDEGQIAPELLAAIATDPTVAAAVAALGFHYPNSDVPRAVAALADRHAIPLWASEDDSTVEPAPSAPATPRPRAQPAGGCLARTINENYIQANITATIVWNLVMARYPQLRWDYTALVSATDPFNGHYDVMPAAWAAAHTTQFTVPGWRLLKHGTGSGWLANGGTYVGYAGPAGELTVVIEKMDAAESNCERGSRAPGHMDVTVAENATFVLQTAPRPGNDSFALWASHFGGNESATTLFQRQPNVPVVDGKVTLEILPNWVYTLSTVPGGRGSTTPPAQGRFPASYTDDFESCVPPAMPLLVAPMSGAFECTAATGRPGISVRQTSPAMAICDRGDVTPYSIIGDGFRTTYNVSLDVRLPPSSTSAAFIGGRAKGPVGAGTGMDGIFFVVNATHWWVALHVNETVPTGLHSARGRLPAATLVHGWQTLELTVAGSLAHGKVNGHSVSPAAGVRIPAPYDHYTSKVGKLVVNLGAGGYATFGSVGYSPVEFDALSVQSS
jgi:galactosylceramidase